LLLPRFAPLPAWSGATSTSDKSGNVLHMRSVIIVFAAQPKERKMGGDDRAEECVGREPRSWKPHEVHYI